MWCAVTGSDLDGGSDAEAAERDQALWFLHELATDYVFLDQANITFRSELVRDLLPNLRWKVVTDTVGGDGNLTTTQEMRDTAQQCRALYEADLGLNCLTDPDQQADPNCPANWGVVGLYAKHVGRTSRPNEMSWKGRGGPGLTWGSACVAATNPDGTTTPGPPAVTMMNGGFIATEETIRNIAAVDEERAGIFLGHEFGHALWLGHGNGEDDGTNGLWDDACDSEEDVGDIEPPGSPECLDPTTVMTPGSCEKTRVTTLSPLQIEMTRGIAEEEPGAIDPPGPFVPGPVVSDGRSDPRLDVALDRIDLAEARVTVDENEQITLFSHSLYRFTEAIPGGIRFVAFVDTDGDPATGGNPGTSTTPSFPTAFQGAELITIVSFREGEFGPSLGWSVLKWNGTEFQRVDDSRIDADLRTLFAADPFEEVSDYVAISVPNDIVGATSAAFRLQAIAEDLDSGSLDRVPDAAAAAVVLRLVPPVFPECSVVPDRVEQGGSATVTVTGLIPNHGVKVILGSSPAAMGMADDAGAAAVTFRIPASARTGQRLVTVGALDTALTADCTVVVEGRPIALAPDTSTNELGQDHTLTATVRDEEGDPVAGMPVSFSVVSGPNADSTGECTFNADCTTDPEGMVFFTYTGAGGPGVDQITAAFHPNGGEPLSSNVAFKFWDTDCNQNEVADSCDVDCAGFGGLCGEGFVGMCALSADANGDGFPDECNRPPDCSMAGAEPDELWPPNHKFKEIAVAGVTDEDGDPVSVTITAVEQDEPVLGKGSGKTAPDSGAVGESTAEVRSERTGTGDGRVYHIDFTAEDGRGGECSGEVTVCVPHDMRPGHVCIDQGPLFDSTEALSNAKGAGKKGPRR
jgi:hypothetical protein